VPLNFTPLAAKNPVPVIVTEVPTAPLVGEKLVMESGTLTVNELAEVAVPLGVATETVPVIAPFGTLVAI
jgi:hypothetical protein